MRRRDTIIFKEFVNNYRILLEKKKKKIKMIMTNRFIIFYL